VWTINWQEIQDFDAHLIRLEHKKKQLDDRRPLPDIALQKIKEGLFLEWTYNSNSIEGNTLSLNETRIVLEEGMTVKGKSLKEHFEITNHHEAIEYLERIVYSGYSLSERDILDVHFLVLNKIEKNYAGRLRNGGVRITGTNFSPPNASHVSTLLSELISFVNSNEKRLSDEVLATLFHHRFVWIHPFFDGNGRTVRLVMNLLLMRSGFPPAIILKIDRKKYYDALNQANNGSYSKLLLLMIQAVERSLDIYLSIYPDAEQYMSIADVIKEEQMPYGQEYISLLARQGKIDAYKEGREWFTTSSAIKEYISTRKRKRKLS
jgi:Fic family protein